MSEREEKRMDRDRKKWARREAAAKAWREAGSSKVDMFLKVRDLARASGDYGDLKRIEGWVE